MPPFLKIISIRFAILFGVLGLSFSGYAQTMIGTGIDYQNPGKYTVAGISVVGAKYSDVQAIKLFSGLQEGKEIVIPGDAITDAVRKLWKQKLFTNIKISIAEFRGQEVYLVIELTEMPRLGRYSIEGIKK